MSSIFKDRMGDGAVEKGASFKRGCSGLNHPLVEELIGCLTEQNPDQYRQSHYYDRIVETEFPDDFDHNLFLEGLMTRLAAAEPGEYLERLEYMFNPLLKSLYNKGCNGFELDFSNYPTLAWMAGGFQGEPERVFELIYNGDVHTFGRAADYCKINYNGRSTFFGLRATWSYLCADQIVVCPGLEAEDSMFRFIRGTPELWTPRGIGMRNTNHEQPKRCAFFLDQGSDDVDMDYLVKEQFFERENSLWVPDGKGGWEKVFPE